MKRVAVNGFGRIGRAYVRLAAACPDIDIVAVNDLMDVGTAAYLLRYDTAHGKYDREVEPGDGVLRIGGKETRFLSVKNPTELPWRSLDIDVVVESTGVFASYEKAYMHVVAGAKHVIITAPVKDEPPEHVKAATVLMGVNSDVAEECVMTSNASCTTNAVGIPLNILNTELGIESAILNTVHGYTTTQHLVDGPTKKNTNLRYGRAAAMNIVPSSTGAAVATAKVLPSLRNSFDGIALRVPTVVGSIVDLTCVSKTYTTAEAVNGILRKHAGGLFSVTEEPVVSSDIIGERFVSVADLTMTRVVNGTLIKVLLWYDNEVGYAQSLIEHTRHGV